MSNEGKDEARGGYRGQIGIKGTSVYLQDVVRIPVDDLKLCSLHLLVQILLEHADLGLIAILQPLLKEDCSRASVQSIQPYLDNRGSNEEIAHLHN